MRRAFVLAFVEKGDTIPTGVFGLIHRRVGVPKQQVAVQRRLGADVGDADAGGDEDLALRDFERQRLAEAQQQSVAEIHRVGQRRRLWIEHGVLVAGDPRDGRAWRRDGAQTIGDDAQYLVAGRMPEAVVDVLEPVEIDEEQRRQALPPPRLFRRLTRSVSSSRSNSSARFGSPVREPVWAASTRAARAIRLARVARVARNVTARARAHSETTAAIRPIPLSSAIDERTKMNRTSAPANVAVERGDPLLRLFTLTPIILVETSSSVLLIRRVGFGSLLLVSTREHRARPLPVRIRRLRCVTIVAVRTPRKPTMLTTNVVPIGIAVYRDLSAMTSTIADGSFPMPVQP